MLRKRAAKNARKKKGLVLAPGKRWIREKSTESGIVPGAIF